MIGFAKWWFLNGGSINRLWKTRQYADIKNLAMALPKAAYEQGKEDALTECLELAKVHGAHWMEVCIKARMTQPK